MHPKTYIPFILCIPALVAGVVGALPGTIFSKSFPIFLLLELGAYFLLAGIANLWIEKHVQNFKRTYGTYFRTSLWIGVAITCGFVFTFYTITPSFFGTNKGYVASVMGCIGLGTYFVLSLLFALLFKRGDDKPDENPPPNNDQVLDDRIFEQ